MTNPDFQQNPPQILVVDDQKTLRLVLHKAMEKQGYQIIEACNGQHCLDICQKVTPDMILLDARMPGMDGFACCSKLQTLMGDNCPPVLMVTVLDDQESIERAFQVGASDYITKPIDWGVLARRVNRLLTSRWAILETRRQIERECRLTVSLETANRELQNLASTDALTKVASRSYFNEYLQREWKRLQKYQLPLSLIMCKIDFAQIDSQAKDNDLCHIADIMRKCKKRSTDFIARYSDEIFVMILANTEAEEATEVIKILQNSIESLDIQNEYLKISFGTASMIPLEESSAYQLVKNAEQQLAINNEKLTEITHQ
ncbi:diguanylate cyclase (GGDEF) domain-containing protein [Rivularia sp. PCC 7116]|uniref:GGDEF domain-containing response regulator n=1 Tax=Rivularia sp. PCC 7116 TaxID=373994 RepID=UPI00029EC7C0|nr:response regulator [Rivularia sp. PCC 7116]AFY57825.1 diguanylate cyclase (GGDEF) domain-containing protein [Rivularia sp. PCC 7116]